MDNKTATHRHLAVPALTVSDESYKDMVVQTCRCGCKRRKWNSGKRGGPWARIVSKEEYAAHRAAERAKWYVDDAGNSRKVGE